MKKIKDTKLFNAIKEHAPDLLESLGAVFPPLGAVGKMINDRNEEVKEAILEAYEQDYKDLANARESNSRIQESQFSSFLARNTGYFLDLFMALIWGTLTVFIIGKAFHFVGDGVNFTEILSVYATVTAIFSQVVSFHRGSSMGSKMKDLK